MARHDFTFKSRAEYTKHMRETHDESPYPCTKASCKRVNGKGFFRKRDMLKHMKKEHDTLEEAVVVDLNDSNADSSQFFSQLK
jgi:predicted small metal-binding protein